MINHLSMLCQTTPIFIWGLFLYVLNLIDMMATLVFVVGYGAIEMNPLVDLMLQYDPTLFILFKVGIVGGLITFLSDVSARPVFRKKALVMLTALYFLLFLWHLGHFIWFGMAGAF